MSKNSSNIGLKKRNRKSRKAILNSRKATENRIIDVHTHVFNVDYLPWLGIVYRYLGRRLGYTVATLARNVAPSRSFDLVLESDSRSLAELIDVNAESVRKLDGVIAGYYKEVTGVSVLRPPRSNRDRIDQLVWFFEQEIYVLKSLSRFTRADAHKEKRNIGQTLKWIWMLLTKSPRKIARKLAGIYPEVDLFVHLMMDMGNHYPTSPAINNMQSQVDRILEELRWENGLSMLVFVAFDPFRSQLEFQDGGLNHLQIVRDAIGKGCAGVKFYPPNGYAPTSNSTETLDRDAPAPEIIDSANEDLFAFCGDEIPILAHSQPGELQAEEGFDRLSRPELWRKVLEKRKFRNLRLCFGHAGSDAWYEGGAFDGSWADQIIQLCVQYPNVYCDFGAFTEVIRDPARRSRFVERLTQIKKAYPGFENKILYGSDWSMIHVDPNHAGYLREFQEIIGAAGYNPDRFFRANAVEFLNLRQYLARNQAKLHRDFVRKIESLL